MVVKISKKYTIRWIQVILALFILFLIIQVIVKMLGGSWGFESLVIGLLIANLGYSWYVNSIMQRHLGKHLVHDRQFAELCKDFKEFRDISNNS